MKVILLASLLLAVAAPKAQATFVPEDQIDYANLPFGMSNIDEAEFKRIIAKIQTSFAPVVSQHGGKLSIEGSWKDEKLNAAATQMFGTWRVVYSGGLARRPELTPDGTALIICHEVGHHLAGFPYAGGSGPGGIGAVWAASEGQSDYFATQVCAPRIWADEREVNASFRAKASDFIKERCDTAWSNEDDQNLCYRNMIASASVTHTMAVLMKKPIPEFHTPDPAVVEKNVPNHPQPQCRMDTSAQGALCSIRWDDGIIPGKKTPGGVTSIDAEAESSRVTCTKASGFVFGLRPLCWFKPRM